jgi:hypothetical protein
MSAMWSHNVDRLEEYIAERRIERGMNPEHAHDFDAFPMSDDEIEAAERWYTERRFA